MKIQVLHQEVVPLDMTTIDIHKEAKIRIDLTKDLVLLMAEVFDSTEYTVPI